MRKATHIKPEDIANLQYDENGNIIIPEGYEIYIKEDPSELKAKRIAELETEINNMEEPTDLELIEEGKMMNHYYMLKMELDGLKNN